MQKLDKDHRRLKVHNIRKITIELTIIDETNRCINKITNKFNIPVIKFNILISN